jgi:hypothetical protein
MPWTGNVFVRENPDFSGPTVWQQDQQATIKIIAFRHDDHDQDIAEGISATLNLDGLNAMRAALDVGMNTIDNLTDASSPQQAVSLAQLDAGVASVVTLIEDATIDSATWSGNLLSLISTDQTVTVDIRTFSLVNADTFKSGGKIRHLLNDSIAIDVNVANRHTADNDGGVTLTFSGIPTSSDTYLGDDYQAEGQVIVWNSASPGAVTLAGLTSPRILGMANTTSNGVSILTYMFDVIGGSLAQSVIVWSA